MPVFNTAIYDAQKEPRGFVINNTTGVVTASPSRLGDANIASGDVEFAVIPYTIATPTTEVANDTINLCVLPSGCIPIPALSKIVRTVSVGTTLTLDVGTAADTDGWIDGAAIGGAVTEVSATSTTPPPAWAAPTPLVADAGSGNAVVKATIASASALAPGVTVYFVLAYKRVR